MRITRKMLSKIAQKILDQIEPIHSDDPKVDQAFKEGHDRVIRVAKAALERWVKRF